MKLSFLLLLMFFSTSCSSDDDDPQSEIIGTWELTRIVDSQSGSTEAPNDGKPIQITFKSDNSFSGKAGNNEIMGTYNLEGSELIFKLSATEITNTDWELLFMQSIEESRNGQEYTTLFEAINDEEFSLEYNSNSNVFFVRI